MPRCGGSKPDGSPCERIVPASQRYCYAHDPARAGERRRNASRAGKSRGSEASREVRAVKQQLQEIADGVLSGSVDRADGAVAGQLLNVKLRALELERRWHTTDDLAARVGDLREALEREETRWRNA